MRPWEPITLVRKSNLQEFQFCVLIDQAASNKNTLIFNIHNPTIPTDQDKSWNILTPTIFTNRSVAKMTNIH